MNYSGKKKCHTVKFQAIISETGEFLFIDYFPENCHDFSMFKQARRDLSQAGMILADSGYQGLDKLYLQALTPIKSSKNHPLTASDKSYNRELSQIRIKVENQFARIKNFKLFSNRNRNHKRRMNLRFNLLATVCNLVTLSQEIRHLKW